MLLRGRTTWPKASDHAQKKRDFFKQGKKLILLSRSWICLSIQQRNINNTATLLLYASASGNE